MKKVVLNHLVIAALAVAAAFTSCGGGSGSGGGKSSGKITMTTESSGNSFYLSGSGVATVDWGDGSEKVSRTLHESESFDGGVHFSHNYPNASIRTITINGDNITVLTLIGQISITNLDVSRCTDLTRLKVERTSLASLDLSKNTALTELAIDGSHLLTSLDVSKNTALTSLSVHGSKLTSLDVSKNTALTSLSVHNSPLLTSLDVSKNTALTSLSVENVPLKSLDVSKNTTLTWLYVPVNGLTTFALNDLFGTLHSNAGAKRIYIGGNPGERDCDRSIAERKGWAVQQWR